MGEANYTCQEKFMQTAALEIHCHSYLPSLYPPISGPHNTCFSTSAKVTGDFGGLSFQPALKLHRALIVDHAEKQLNDISKHIVKGAGDKSERTDEATSHHRKLR